MLRDEQTANEGMWSLTGELRGELRLGMQFRENDWEGGIVKIGHNKCKRSVRSE